ncbi:MAG: proteasome accessory factor PafA2 family protein [Nitrospira sp.]|nr:proteasome accessory factor PafA2 family protein [Nitrospira sp.]
MRLFGIETEYGITREDQDHVDPVVESMELVRAHHEGPFKQHWDYRGEEPHEDQRGFRVSGLQQDKEEEAFAKEDAHRSFSFYEMKSDLVLMNGARFYNDHTHPEYATPECRTLRDLVAHDRAGERIVQQSADKRNHQLGSPVVQLYKNNTDFHGHSYGCHDNYLVSRAIPFSDLVQALVPFLVSRQVIAGAGKVGLEKQEQGYQSGGFQLSQRADFMEAVLGVDTMYNRPILNTRDEPHADRSKYRRLHLIIGDANMCEYATALKVGTTRVVLDMLEQRLTPDVELEDPVRAVQAFSRDPELKTFMKTRRGPALSACEIQAEYLEAAERAYKGRDEETDWILEEWARVLTTLKRDRWELVGSLDWITKLWLLERFRQEEHLDWSDPWLASIDLEYHNVNPERGLYMSLEADGQVKRVCQEEDILRAIREGPMDTRGGIRGKCVKRFAKDIHAVQWERIQFKSEFGQRTNLDLHDVVEPEAVQAIQAELDGIVTPFELARMNERSVI